MQRVIWVRQMACGLHSPKKSSAQPPLMPDLLRYPLQMRLGDIVRNEEAAATIPHPY